MQRDYDKAIHDRSSKQGILVEVVYVMYTQTFAYITTLLKATVQVGSEPEQPAYI